MSQWLPRLRARALAWAGLGSSSGDGLWFQARGLLTLNVRCSCEDRLIDASLTPESEEEKVTMPL